MKIAILGTKGIPNNYGGYEQFAEYISLRLLAMGHSVTVYNPHFHKYKGDDFKGVKIIRKYSPEGLLGGAANIIYDHLCLKDALSRDFDIIYEAGYHSVALSFAALKVKHLKKPVIVTNMDGLEYKRSKWTKPVQRIIENLERIAVKHSPFLISDNLGIKDYLLQKYNADSFYLPYGADPVHQFDLAHLQPYDITKHQYLMLVARMEPENNIETVIIAHLKSQLEIPLLVVGNHTTKFGRYLKAKYSGSKVRFVGGIYNKAQLDSLRHFSLAYFHGHSVGGTNPSLLEAMASQSFIVAHSNPFNRGILGDSAFYFDTADDLAGLITNLGKLRAEKGNRFVTENFEKVNTLYNWDRVTADHLALFEKLLE